MLISSEWYSGEPKWICSYFKGYRLKCYDYSYDLVYEDPVEYVTQYEFNDSKLKLDICCLGF